MKSLTLVFFSLLSVPVFGQQNLFNVPSSDITPAKKPFFQQQFTASEGIVQLNSTFSFGLGKNTEIGINLIGLNVNTTSSGNLIQTNANVQKSPVYPFYLINFQKAFVLNDRYKLALGTQTGFSQGGHFGSYDYLNLVSIIPKYESKIITGVYYATNTFLGPEERLPFFNISSPLGFQIGFEQPIIEGKLLLIAENISGLHNLSETTVGGAYALNKHWLLSAGFQFSNPGSKTPEAIIIEFTYIPFATVIRE